MGNSPAQNPVTPLRGYALPVAGNFLADDVVRLGNAISAIDTDMGAAATKLVSIRGIAASYTVLTRDLSTLLDYTGSSPSDVVTLPVISGLPSGFNVRVRNSSSVTITIATSNGATINGQSTYALLPSSTIHVVTDTSTWKVLSVAQVSAGLLTASGTASAPAHSFTADPSVGLYLPTTGQGGLAAAGSSALFWSSAGVLVGGAAGGFQGAGSINAAKLFYNGQDMVARADGTAAAPTYSFGSEASTGVYRAGAGLYGIAVSGVLQLLVTANGLRGAGATAVSGTQLSGSANLTDLYLNGVSLGSSLTFGPGGVAVAGATGGAKGAGTLNATDLYVKGSSLGSLLGLNGSVGGTLNLTDLTLAGASLASSMTFGANGVALPGATGGVKGAGSMNVQALYINGTILNPGLITPSVGNALTYLRINATGNGVDYRTPSQVLNDLGVQTALGYVPVNRNGDTMSALTIQGTFQVGAAASFASSLAVQGVASLTALSVSTSAGIVGSLVVSGVTTLAAASATSMTVGGSLGVSGASTLAALTATTGRFTSNVTVLGSTALASLSASSASFSGAVSLTSTLNVTGATVAAKFTATGAAVFSGGASFSGGISLNQGNLAIGFGQQLTTTDTVNGFQFQSGALSSGAGSTMLLSQSLSSTGSNQQALRLLQRRLSAGADWTTAATRLQLRTGVVDQGYIEWAPVASGLGGLRIGAVDSNGIDQSMLTIDPNNGVTLAANVSINSFLGVGGGAQLNGGVSLTGGVTVDTLTGTANWSTTGNLSCRYVTQTSDERLKTDFGGVGEDLAWVFLEDAEPVSYRWRTPVVGDSRHFGYRAQQLQRIGLQELVHQAPADGMLDALSLDYASMIALLHVALRRAQREIGQLRARVDGLDPSATL